MREFGLTESVRGVIEAVPSVARSCVAKHVTMGWQVNPKCKHQVRLFFTASS